MVRQRITPNGRRAEIEDRLAGWALQGGYLVESYARLVGLSDVEDVAVVLGSLLRIYDDALDERQDGLLVGERLGRLFAGEEIAPESDVEWIVVDLFRWLVPRVPSSSRDALFTYLGELHALQLEGLDVCPGRAPGETVQHAIEKGGPAMAILAGSINPGVEPAELTVLYRLGGLLQLIDDYDDTDEDRDMITSARSGLVPFGALVAELRAVSQDIAAYYGSTRAQPFLDRLCIWLAVIGLRRMLDQSRLGRRGVEPTAVPQRALTMIALRKGHIR